MRGPALGSIKALAQLSRHAGDVRLLQEVVVRAFDHPHVYAALCPVRPPHRWVMGTEERHGAYAQQGDATTIGARLIALHRPVVRSFQPLAARSKLVARFCQRQRATLPLPIWAQP